MFRDHSHHDPKTIIQLDIGPHSSCLKFRQQDLVISNQIMVVQEVPRPFLLLIHHLKVYLLVPKYAAASIQIILILVENFIVLVLQEAVGLIVQRMPGFDDTGGFVQMGLDTEGKREFLGCDLGKLDPADERQALLARGLVSLLTW